MSPAESKLPERYLSVKDFARIAGISEKSVHRYLRDGKLPKYQPGGENCRVSIPASALEVTAQRQVDDSSPQPAAPVADAAAPPNVASAAKAGRKRPLPKPSWMR